MRNINSISASSIATLFVVSMIGCTGGTGDNNTILRPTVTNSAPANNATDVPITSPIITATFSEQMSPINGSATFTVASATLGNVAGSVALDSTKRIATFTPSALLAPSTSYTATISGVSSNTTGRAIQNDYVWSFTTGVTPAAVEVQAEQ